MDTSHITDKAPLPDYLKLVADGVLEALDQIEQAHPEWITRALDVTVRCALRPELSPDGKTLVRVWADMDVSRSQQVTEITLPLRRE